MKSRRHGERPWRASLVGALLPVLVQRVPSLADTVGPWLRT
jgi:hypothetical protein